MSICWDSSCACKLGVCNKFVRWWHMSIRKVLPTKGFVQLLARVHRNPESSRSGLNEIWVERILVFEPRIFEFWVERAQIFEFWVRSNPESSSLVLVGIFWDFVVEWISSLILCKEGRVVLTFILCMFFIVYVWCFVSLQIQIEVVYYMDWHQICTLDWQ